MFRDSALYKFTTDIDNGNDATTHVSQHWQDLSGSKANQHCTDSMGGV